MIDSGTGRRARAGGLTRRFPAAVAASALLLVGPGATGPAAHAQEPPPAVPTTTAAPTVAPPPSVLPTTPPGGGLDPYFITPRDLTGCPFRTSPPPGVDASVLPSPGAPTLPPPSVPATPAGGDRMGGCDRVLADGFAAPSTVTASGWIVADLSSGEVLAARDPHGRYRPASIIKLLLALVAERELDPRQVVRVSDSEFSEADGTLVGLGEGGMYSIDRLMHALLMYSGNDAAYELAFRLGGVPEALRKMNAEARRLGCTDTLATSVSGLDIAGNMTSAYDMALITREATSRPALTRILATQRWGMPGYPASPEAGAPDPDNPPTEEPTPVVRPDGTTIHPGFVIHNDNQLLYNYPGALGGKTGFTDNARQTYVGVARRDGRALAVVLLDGTRLPRAPWEQAVELLDAGWATPRGRPVGSLVAPGSPAPPKIYADATGAPETALAAGAPATASTVRRLGPPLGLGLAITVLLVGVAAALRSRRAGRR